MMSISLRVLVRGAMVMLRLPGKGDERGAEALKVEEDDGHLNAKASIDEIEEKWMCKTAGQPVDGVILC